MIGIIQKVLVDMVRAEGGEEALAEVKRRAKVEQDVYRIDTVYSDAECVRLFSAASEVLGLSSDDTWTVYSDYFCRDALDRWPTWFQMSKNARQFLERQPVIHNTFATGLRDPEERKAVTDKFRIERFPDELVTHYRSPNQLCGLYRGLARWILAHYGETATIEEPLCMHRGDPECEIHIRWVG